MLPKYLPGSRIKLIVSIRYLCACAGGTALFNSKRLTTPVTSKDFRSTLPIHFGAIRVAARFVHHRTSKNFPDAFVETQSFARLNQIERLGRHILVSCSRMIVDIAQAFLSRLKLLFNRFLQCDSQALPRFNLTPPKRFETVRRNFRFNQSFLWTRCLEIAFGTLTGFILLNVLNGCSLRSCAYGGW